MRVTKNLPSKNEEVEKKPEQAISSHPWFIPYIVEEAEKQAEVFKEEGKPPYQIMQAISSQISRAQSGQGPFSERFRDIAILAIAAIIYGDAQ